MMETVSIDQSFAIAIITSKLRQSRRNTPVKNSSHFTLCKAPLTKHAE
jgi:hypothetical protein